MSSRLARGAFACGLCSAALGLGCAPEPGVPDARVEPGTSAPAAPPLDEPIQPIPRVRANDPGLARLGRALFSSTLLSDDGSLSCSSCHAPAHAMADGLPFSSTSSRPPTVTNATTLYNVRYFPKLGWTGKFSDVGEQLDALIENPQLMRSSWPRVIDRLRQSRDWSERFDASFADGLTIDNARAALVEYERSLVTPGAPFDAWLAGDPGALSADAATGYALFKDYGCVSCHQGVAVGANLFQRLGVMRDYYAGHAPRDADLGRYNLTRRDEDRNVFRVPSLRNVALTGPYLHDGSVASLPAVVRLMADLQLGISLRDEEVRELTAFLGALTGELEPEAP